MHHLKRFFALLAVASVFGVALPATTTRCGDALVGLDTTVGPISNGEGDEPPDDPSEPPPSEAPLSPPDDDTTSTS